MILSPEVCTSSIKVQQYMNLRRDRVSYRCDITREVMGARCNQGSKSVEILKLKVINYYTSWYSL